MLTRILWIYSMKYGVMLITIIFLCILVVCLNVSVRMIHCQTAQEAKRAICFWRLVSCNNSEWEWYEIMDHYAFCTWPNYTKEIWIQILKRWHLCFDFNELRFVIRVNIIRRALNPTQVRSILLSRIKLMTLRYSLAQRAATLCLGLTLRGIPYRIWLIGAWVLIHVDECHF